MFQTSPIFLDTACPHHPKIQCTKSTSGSTLIPQGKPWSDFAKAQITPWSSWALVSLGLLHLSSKGAADPPRDPPAVPGWGNPRQRWSLTMERIFLDRILVECCLQGPSELLIEHFKVKVRRTQPILSARPQVTGRGLTAQSKSFFSTLHR